jgi:hypothetical protein
MLNNNQSGFGLIKLFLMLLVLAIIGYTGWYVWNTNIKIKVDTYINKRTPAEKACLESFYKILKQNPKALVEPCLDAAGNHIF